MPFDEAKLTQVYHYIVAHKIHHDGNAPTIREIATGCRIKSTSTAARYVRILRDRGHVKLLGDGHCRQVEVVGGSWRPPQTCPVCGDSWHGWEGNYGGAPIPMGQPKYRRGHARLFRL